MTDTKRISLRAIQPGQKLLRVEAKNFTGPRGGSYVFRGASPRHGTAMTFTHSTLSRDGKTRTFHFENCNPFEISDALSCKLVAQVAV